MANRVVFGLAAAMGALSFLVSHFDQYFFTLHFIESLIYFVILLLMFYRLEEWAYPIGMAAPVFWIILSVAGGTLSTGSLGQFGQALMGGGVDSPVRFLGAVMLFIALALLITSARAFYRGVWGTPDATKTLVTGVALTAAFYASLVYAVLQMSTPAG